MNGIEYKPLTSTFHLLVEGQIFKNYKELCIFLCQPVGTGCSKMSQLDTFSRYFEYEKMGHKFLITSVYLEPLQDESRGKFSPLIQKLLLDYLATEYNRINRSEILITKTQLYRKVGPVKSQYSEFINDTNTLSDKLDIKEYVVGDFYNMTNNKLSNYYVTALNYLKAQSVIDFEQTYIVKTIESNTHRRPTPHEKAIFIEAEFYARKSVTDEEDIIFNTSTGEYEYYTINEVFTRGLWRKYLNKLNEYVLQSGLDYIDFFYKGYAITLTKNVLSARDRVNKYVIDNKSDVIMNLNDLFVESYKKLYCKWHDNATKDIENVIDTLSKAKLTSIRVEDMYVENGHKLIDAMINMRTNFYDYVVNEDTLIIDEGVPFKN